MAHAQAAALRVVPRQGGPGQLGAKEPARQRGAPGRAQGNQHIAPVPPPEAHGKVPRRLPPQPRQAGAGGVRARGKALRVVRVDVCGVRGDEVPVLRARPAHALARKPHLARKDDGPQGGKEDRAVMRRRLVAWHPCGRACRRVHRAPQWGDMQ